GALILGQYKKDKLEYIGHTGTGFNQQMLKDLWDKMQPLVISKSPFPDKIKTNMPVTWLKPKLVCQVNFTEATEDGKLRHPVYMGLREDKNHLEVKAETETPVKTTSVKTLSKKAITKKPASKKAAPKKTSKKAAPKKATSKKAAPKKTTTKKTSVKKKVTKSADAKTSKKTAVKAVTKSNEKSSQKKSTAVKKATAKKAKNSGGELVSPKD